MPIRFATLLFLVIASGATMASAADLRERNGYRAYGPPPYGGSRIDYEALWSDRMARQDVDPSRPHRRVMGGPDYVGSNWGLGKPAVSGIGPRPDWGRSTYD